MPERSHLVAYPFPRRPANPSPGHGGDRARRVAETLAGDIVFAVGRLSTADKNRALLGLAAFIATQLEALEADNDPEME